MTLESSGTLYLKGSSAAPTRSIQYELEGVYTGIGLLEARNLAGWSGTVQITDFYGYSACSETAVPSTYLTSVYWIANGVINLGFFVSTADSVDFQRSTNNSTWSDLTLGYTGSSPYVTSNSCTYVWYRMRGTNCYGTQTYTSGVYAGTCP